MRALAAILLALLALAPLRDAAAAASFNPFKEAGIDRKPDAQIPLDLGLRDANGNAVTLRQLAQGKPLVLVPVLHNCPNICGVTLVGLAQSIGAQVHPQGFLIGGHAAFLLVLFVRLHQFGMPGLGRIRALLRSPT